MDVNREEFMAFLILSRSALSNLCYSQGDIEIIDEELKDLKAEISELEEKLHKLLLERAQMQSAIEARDYASDMLAHIEVGETIVINVTK